MNIGKTLGCLACAAAFCGVAAGGTNDVEASEAETPQGWNWAMGEGLSYGEQSVASAEVSIGFDSKYLTYGLVDNNDPIYRIDGSVTFFDWFCIGSYALFDMSRYGEAAGYKNRQGKAIEYNPYAEIRHAYGPNDAAWLPTTVEFAFGFDYEYHPRVCTGAQWIDGEYCEGQPRGGDSMFWTFELGLPDLWLEPVFLYERDTMRDHGTYLNLEIGHTFALIDGAGEDDDPVLAFRPSVSQGWGDRKRVRGYLGCTNPVTEEYESVDHSGLMDTVVKGELTWNVCSGVALSGYVAYSDYLFEPSFQNAATEYEATGVWTKSWNFTAGLALAVSF